MTTYFPGFVMFSEKMEQPTPSGHTYRTVMIETEDGNIDTGSVKDVIEFNDDSVLWAEQCAEASYFHQREFLWV